MFHLKTGSILSIHLNISVQFKLSRTQMILSTLRNVTQAIHFRFVALFNTLCNVKGRYYNSFINEETEIGGIQ